MAQVIADTTFFARRPAGDVFELPIRIEAPEQVSADEWVCRVDMAALEGEPFDVHASSSLQALCLATSVVLQRLREFREAGGELFIAPGQPLPLEAFDVAETLRMWS